MTLNTALILLIIFSTIFTLICVYRMLEYMIYNLIWERKIFPLEKIEKLEIV
uniref:Uncharacterized protein n=1 Tax=viral metagenome TaxID=1070528 RepID=A0A6C0JBR9_9ZZZZ